MSATALPNAAEFARDLAENTRDIATHGTRISSLEEKHRDVVGELRDFRKESSSRLFSLMLFAATQLFALIGGMALLLYNVVKKG